MGEHTPDTEKQREIRFCPLHPDPDQAENACLLLAEWLVVHSSIRVSDRIISITYDLVDITYTEIEEALVELGFHLDSSLMCKLRRALYAYTEENERANLKARPTHQIRNDTQGVFISRYQKLRHGCRDARPRHWREYL
jgi:hypothetical protein